MQTHRCLFILTTLLALVACNNETPSAEKTSVIRPVKLINVTQAQAGAVRSFPATVESAKVSDLSFRIGGKLEQVPMQNGQRVEKGDLLAQLDDQDAKEDALTAKNEFELARDNFKRATDMLKKSFISQVDFDAAKNRKVSAEAALVKANNRVKYSRLLAPFSGVISNVRIENFQTVSANQAIAVLQVSDVIEVVFSVPEQILLSMRESDEEIRRQYRPQVSFASLPGQFFSAQYKEHQARSNPGSQTYDVTLAMDKPDDLIILPGMTATVQVDFSQLQSSTKKQTWQIPFNTLVQIDEEPVEKNGAAWVWRFNPKNAQVNKVKVNVERIINEFAAVSGELNEGDQLVAAGLHLLNDGMTVKPLERHRGL